MEMNDENQVRKWYKASAQEQPSEQLDAAVLAMAKAHTTSRQFKWRRYQWPFSVAASVLLVSVLYLTNTQQFEVDSAVQDTVSSAPMATPANAELAKKPANKLKLPANKVLADSGVEQKATAEKPVYRAKQTKYLEAEQLQTSQSRYQLDDELTAKLDQLLTRFVDEQESASAEDVLFNAVLEIKQAHPSWQVPEKYQKHFNSNQRERIKNIRP